MRLERKGHVIDHSMPCLTSWEILPHMHTEHIALSSWQASRATLSMLRLDDKCAQQGVLEAEDAHEVQIEKVTYLMLKSREWPRQQAALVWYRFALGLVFSSPSPLPFLPSFSCWDISLPDFLCCEVCLFSPCLLFFCIHLSYPDHEYGNFVKDHLTKQMVWYHFSLQPVLLFLLAGDISAPNKSTFVGLRRSIYGRCSLYSFPEGLVCTSAESSVFV